MSLKSPIEIGERLARQWQRADVREAHLLAADAWPTVIPIGKPASAYVRNRTGELRTQLDAWRQVRVGTVVWQRVRFRGLAEAVDLPVHWVLAKPGDWIDAANSGAVAAEFQRLEEIVAHSHPDFHSFVIRQRHLLAGTATADVIKAAEVVCLMRPGCAAGAPLRSLSIAGIDTKFLERHRALITRMLDIRYDGLASSLGLESFLGATTRSDQWLLVADLDGHLLTARQLRIRADELRLQPLPGQQVIIVENEQCLHLLPLTPHTVAILGAGLNLTWLDADWLNHRRIAYWGDIDTWGLAMLAMARELQPHITPLLMDAATFHQFRAYSVNEPSPASPLPPGRLSADEQALYRQLQGTDKGRLEQEFLPKAAVEQAILHWSKC
jgi:hypothetical protein